MLRFTLFGFPVEVHWPFWLTAALLSGAAYANNPEAITGMIIGMVVIFVSIIVHELGHAFAMRHFGERQPEITLHAFGGYARGSHWRSRTEQIIISLAGPAAGGALGLLAWMLWGPWLADSNRWLALTIYQFMIINFVWTIFNLLPIYPMDGGQVSMAFLSKRRGGDRVALIISMILSGILAIWQLMSAHLLTALLLASFAFDNYKMLKHQPRLDWMQP